MTKADLVEQVAEKTGLTRTDVAVVVDSFLDTIKRTMEEVRNFRPRIAAIDGLVESVGHIDTCVKDIRIGGIDGDRKDLIPPSFRQAVAGAIPGRASVETLENAIPIEIRRVENGRILRVYGQGFHKAAVRPMAGPLVAPRQRWKRAHKR